MAASPKTARIAGFCPVSVSEALASTVRFWKASTVAVLPSESVTVLTAAWTPGHPTTNESVVVLNTALQPLNFALEDGESALGSKFDGT
jgi:hypothetical protein